MGPNDKQRARISQAIKKMRQGGELKLFVGETADLRGLFVGVGAEDLTVEVSEVASNRGYFIVVGHTVRQDGGVERVLVSLNREQAGHLGYVLQELARNAAKGTEVGRQGTEFELEQESRLVWRGDASLERSITTTMKVED